MKTNQNKLENNSVIIQQSKNSKSYVKAVLYNDQDFDEEVANLMNQELYYGEVNYY